MLTVIPDSFRGLDLLSTAVVLLDGKSAVRYLNPAAENLLAASTQALRGQPFDAMFDYSPSLKRALDNAIRNGWGFSGQDIEFQRRDDSVVVHLDCVVTPVESEDASLLLELRAVDQQIRAGREERLIEQQQASRELIRNLAHEIKNPLGGIRGAAQLLEYELAGLADAPAYEEYTQVIIKESDRLQDLMQRLLSPHRPMQPSPVNIHEIVERVRTLLTAEFPDQLAIRRDYDTSLPDLVGDREQLIQAILNIARNAAQAMSGSGEIVFRTRALRQVTLVKRRYRLALELQVIDNGPGVPESIRERMFYPLVSGRPDGSGLGLTLAQSFVQQHHGTIECESRPGRTVLSVRLPLDRERLD